MTTEHYRCEHCGTVYDHELLTRVHITRSDDEAHRNHSGLMPECEIEVVDASGTLRERRSRRPEEIDPTTLTREDIPTDLSPKRTDAVLVAAHNPETSSHATLTHLVETSLADTDRDPPSKRTVSRALAAFYRPHEDEGPRTRPFGALSPLQQAIIVATLAKPAASAAEIARWADCSESYPPMVRSRRADIIESFKQRLADGESLATIVTETLTTAQQEALAESGHFDAVPVDIEGAAEKDPDAGETAAATDAMLGARSDDWGAPTADNSVMSATPGGTLSTEGDGGNTASHEMTAAADDTPTATGAAESAAAPTPPGTNSNSDVVAATTQSSGDATDGEADIIPVVVQRLERLATNLRFFRASIEPIDAPSDEREMLMRLAENTEKQCDQIIHEVTTNTDARRD